MLYPRTFPVAFLGDVNQSRTQISAASDAVNPSVVFYLTILKNKEEIFCQDFSMAAIPPCAHVVLRQRLTVPKVRACSRRFTPCIPVLFLNMQFVLTDYVLCLEIIALKRQSRFFFLLFFLTDSCFGRVLQAVSREPVFLINLISIYFVLFSSGCEVRDCVWVNTPMLLFVKRPNILFRFTFM